MKKKKTIRLDGVAARAFVATAMVQIKGEAASANTAGPMLKAIEKELAARRKETSK